MSVIWNGIFRDMLITDRFILINLPKTGSTFARTMLKQVHASKLSDRILAKLGIGVEYDRRFIKELLLPEINSASAGQIVTQHGTVQQIPEEHRHKPIISIIRNPLSRYVSFYFHRWWAKHPPANPDDIRIKYPRFPSLSFEEYYWMAHESGKADLIGNLETDISLGLQTIQFIQYFCYNPTCVLTNINEDYIDQGLFWKDIPKVQFLHQENLNQELFEFLLSAGYQESKVAFIRDAHALNVRQKNKHNWQEYYTVELKESVKWHDRLIYKIFPEYA